MKCHKCNIPYVEHKGTLPLHNEIIGDYHIDSVKYQKCKNCGKLLLPYDTVKKIEQKEQKIQNHLIGQLPVCEFISASEAAEILCISKQAFSKHPRIKKGFIYSVIISGKKLYNKKSVNLFGKNGDGRFKLFNQSSNNIKYIQAHDFANGTLSYFRNVDSEEYKKSDSWMIRQTTSNPKYKN